MQRNRIQLLWRLIARAHPEVHKERLSLARARRFTEYLSRTGHSAQKTLAQKVGKISLLSLHLAILHKRHYDLISL